MATTPEAYVHLSTDKTTLTFYYDTLRADRNGKTWGIRDWDAFFSCPAWAGDFNSRSTTVLTAVFDASFRDFRPTTTEGWFYELNLLERIEGLEHLNTSQVTSMGWMFKGCGSLTSLDLSRFDTSQVTDMEEMFSGCESLTALDLSSFDTSEVSYMRGMFYSCESLTTIYCNSSWSDRLSDDMFSGCNSLRGAATNVGNSYDVSMANPETGYFTKKVLS
ncbi:MAG: BspA family leucine-rich repeat surface protein [Porphyromonadaceae bacterium]|nr:BspA family leucine-rich repeat surface protein [Porphyromonadaceae bacterium]